MVKHFETNCGLELFKHTLLRMQALMQFWFVYWKNSCVRALSFFLMTASDLLATHYDGTYANVKR